MTNEQETTNVSGERLAQIIAAGPDRFLCSPVHLTGPEMQSMFLELTTLRERLAAAEALLSRSWLAKQSFWFYDEVCIHHPFFGSGWVAQRNPLLIGKNGTTGAEALRECEPRQFNGWGFDNPIDAYLAAVAAGWLKPQPQAETAEVEK